MQLTGSQRSMELTSSGDHRDWSLGEFQYRVCWRCWLRFRQRHFTLLFFASASSELLKYCCPICRKLNRKVKWIFL